jgi:alkylation response protein AidB-like acyl-CoA dehydrogenase
LPSGCWEFLVIDPAESFYQSDEIVQLYAVVADLARAASPDPGEADQSAVWRRLGEIDVFRLIAPAAPGDGMGLAPGVLSGIFRILARSLVPGPIVEEVFVRPWLSRYFASALSDDQSGGGYLALVDPGATHLWRRLRGDAWLSGNTVNGAVHGVPHAPGAAQLAVAVKAGDMDALILIPSTHPGVTVLRSDGLDPGCPTGKVEFANVVVPDDAILRDGSVVSGLRSWMRVFTAAELLGITEAVVDMTVRYALMRRQFGREIARFQSIKHILAEMKALCLAQRNLVAQTTAEFEGLPRDGQAIAAASAKAYSASVALTACEQGLQVHGGVGFVQEHQLNRYFKATLRRYPFYGTPQELYVEIGRNTLLRAALP